MFALEVVVWAFFSLGKQSKIKGNRKYLKAIPYLHETEQAEYDQDEE